MVLITAFIPYFQREPGLLREAVISIFNQSILNGGVPGTREGVALGDWEPSAGALPGALELEPCEVDLLIVDDGSPISPASELEGLVPPPGCTIRIVERVNGGVSQCRNTGLDSVLPEADYIAMLDSDDVWSPWHLERAVRALAGGADLYTSNWFTAETGDPAFKSMNKVRLEDHRPHRLMSDAYEFVGDPLESEARASIGRPSCLVFSKEKFGDLRNDPTLLYGSEDQLWRFQMYSRSPSIAFSSRPEVRSGVGVSVFSGVKWTSDRGLLILRDRSRCMRKARRLPGFTPGARKIANAAVGRARKDQVASMIHMVRRRRVPKLKTLSMLVRGDPVAPLVWPLWAVQVVSGWALASARAARASAAVELDSPAIAASRASRWSD